MQPDWAAFATAIGTFRETAGRDCFFLTPVEGTYPAGTVLDPETGRPYDPTIEAEGDGWLQAQVNAIVVRGSANATHAKDDVTNQPVGMVEDGEAVFVVSHADWVSHELEGATRVAAFEETYDVTETTPDSTGGGEPDRVLIRGRLA